MEAEVTRSDSTSKRNAKRLNRAIKVLVINGVLIVPNSRGRVCHLVTKDSDSVGSGNRFERATGRSDPCQDGRHLSYGCAHRRKCEARRAADAELTIGNVVIHVALTGMRLAP